MTNFEQITLSEKTLARMLGGVVLACAACPANDICPTYREDDCRPIILNWLKQEVKQNG